MTPQRWIAVLLLAAPPLLAQQPPAREAFVRLNKGDTVAVERFTRDGRTLVGEVVQAGLQLREALETGLSNLDRFQWIGGFGSSVPFYFQDSVQQRLYSTSLADTASVNRRIRLLWFACGRDDPFFPNNARLSDTLHARGIAHTFVATSGGHQMEVFRRQLVDFLPLLFVHRTAVTRRL